MEPLSLVVGALIAAGGYAVGRFSSRRHIRNIQQVQQRVDREHTLDRGRNEPKPLCGCGHHYVFHDRETKKCQTQVVIPGRWTGSQNSTYRQCMCQGYRGPLPLDEYYATDYLNESEP